MAGGVATSRQPIGGLGEFDGLVSECVRKGARKGLGKDSVEFGVGSSGPPPSAPALFLHFASTLPPTRKKGDDWSGADERSFDTRPQTLASRLDSRADGRMLSARQLDPECATLSLSVRLLATYDD